ncbi:LON peptidase substrate-binding domain-containing protein [Photobacterium sp. SDRW27]|uniref:LON peptidase substrate-binding domain-containing protein n=1 Tax=Photobacterium obscurum TaxID=2829490 RepID=UPI002244BDCB|nr:LON peptidase substrate-binding domain-containing protein [Photobacterium obscurum]MCW8331692.1 LON peptidase substrate-binding domain-containing protein [Photobacterium obscurum]
MTQSIPLLFQQRHVLPGGRMPIRIAPGQQMEAFKAALKSCDGFGVCMFDEAEHGHHFFHIGTRVTVEDFDISAYDGSLIATVYGHENFRINALEQSDDGIFCGEYEAIPRWPEIKIRNDQRILAEKLQQMFNKHPELNKLHHEKEFNNLSWLCQRWLEILPVPACEKQALLNAPNCLDTYDYLMSIMQKTH